MTTADQTASRPDLDLMAGKQIEQLADTRRLKHVGEAVDEFLDKVGD